METCFCDGIRVHMYSYMNEEIGNEKRYNKYNIDVLHFAIVRTQ